MADILPPAPITEPPRSYAWIEWYKNLRFFINDTAQNLPWASVNKTGSSLSDIVTRLHNVLQSIQGGTTNEYYHLTASEHSNVSSYRLVMSSSTADLTTSDISAGQAKLHKNTTSGLVKLFVNDGGTIKSVTLS